jgi:hypothetical protein
VARFPRQSEGTDFEAANRVNKSVRYGFGTAEFVVPVLNTQQHAKRGEKGAFISPYRLYGRRTAAVISGRVFQSKSYSI